MNKVELSKISKKFLRKCEKDIYKRIVKRIKELCENPFPSNSIKIKGKKEKIFRIRVGNYRILYEVYSERNLILISEIGKRGNIYD